MAPSCFADLPRIRKRLGKTQKGLAALLGISVRAVRSYEQGWRRVPAYVQKQVALLLFLSRRKELGDLPPCWEVRRCDVEHRARCPAYQFRAGDLCWLFPGQLCVDARDGSWEDGIAECQACPVMRRWLVE